MNYVLTLLNVLACAVYLSAGMPAMAQDSNPAGRWASFLGPPSQPVCADTLPLEWSPVKNVAWKATIPGYGQSSPVVWDGKVVVTSISGTMKDACHVSAFDLATGEPLWQQDFASPMQVENSNYVSKAAPSPIVDENGIVAFFETGRLVSLTHDGNIRWQKDLVEQHGPITSRHGLGSSLAQYGQLAFVWVERQEDPYLLAIEKDTGETRWKSAGLGAASWSTPALVPVADQHHLVLSGSGRLAGYDPENGDQLWTLADLSGNTIPTPQPAGNGAFLIGATVGRGEESAGRAADFNGLVRISRDANGQFTAQYEWHCDTATSSFGSPILHNGLAYFVNATGVLFCVDAESGKELYNTRFGESVWATPLAIGDRIYFVGRSGTTTVVRHGPEFHKLAENHLEPMNASTAAQSESAAKENVYYAVAAVPGTLLIRTGTAIYGLRDLDVPHPPRE